MPYPRVLHSVCLFNGKVFVAGGLSRPNGVQKEVSIFDPKEIRWLSNNIKKDGQPKQEKTSLINLAIPTYASAMTGFKGRIWLLGGVTKSNKKEELKLTNEVQAFDFNKQKWFKLKYKLPIPLAFSSAVEHNGELVVAGGKTVTNNKDLILTDKVFIFNNETKTWGNGPSLIRPVCNICLISYGFHILAFGGTDEVDVQSKACFSWDTSNPNQGWIYEPNALPVPVTGQVVALVQDNKS